MDTVYRKMGARRFRIPGLPFIEGMWGIVTKEGIGGLEGPESIMRKSGWRRFGERKSVAQKKWCTVYGTPPFLVGWFLVGIGCNSINVIEYCVYTL